MATVYLADDLRHERKVALKVLKPELAAVVGAERLPFLCLRHFFLLLGTWPTGSGPRRATFDCQLFE